MRAKFPGKKWYFSEKKVALLCAAQGITLHEFKCKLMLSPSQYARVFKTEPAIETLFLAVDVFKCPVKDMLISE